MLTQLTEEQSNTQDWIRLIAFKPITLLSQSVITGFGLIDLQTSKYTGSHLPYYCIIRSQSCAVSGHSSGFPHPHSTDLSAGQTKFHDTVNVVRYVLYALSAPLSSNSTCANLINFPEWPERRTSNPPRLPEHYHQNLVRSSSQAL